MKFSCLILFPKPVIGCLTINAIKAIAGFIGLDKIILRPVISPKNKTLPLTSIYQIIESHLILKSFNINLKQ